METAGSYPHFCATHDGALVVGEILVPYKYLPTQPLLVASLSHLLPSDSLTPLLGGPPPPHTG